MVLGTEWILLIVPRLYFLTFLVASLFTSLSRLHVPVPDIRFLPIRQNW